MLPSPPLLFITDSAQSKRPLTKIVEDVLQGGCRWVLWREKENGHVEQVRELCTRFGATFFVSRDAELAVQMQADGLHLAANMMVSEARAAVGNHMTLGQSCHNEEEAQAAQDAGVDYITLSPIYESLSKPGYGPPLGLERLNAICEALDLPVLALGGMNGSRAKECLAAGATGVAVMGDFMQSEDPRSLAEEYTKLFT
jgi:thiamine-phosphate pyrophosphorylase